jgi:pimeloyl-ACP methyl ester carboxylesterase
MALCAWLNNGGWQINPATNFAQNNPLVSFCASTGLLAFFPQTLYQIAQDLMLPLMVKRNWVSIKDHETLLSPIDFVPAECGAWRFSMLNDSTGLSDVDIQSINMPTLLFASAKDWVLPSMAECARLQCLLPNAKRVILPERSPHCPFSSSLLSLF